MNFNSSGQRAAFWAGARQALTVTPSYVPFGIVCGVASVNAGLSTGAALALPALVFGGSSQAVVLQFMQNSSSVWVAILSGCVVNLRMAVYSAAMSPKVRHLSTPKRMLAASLLVDNSFAFVQERERKHPNDPYLMTFYAGVSAVVWPSWLLFCAVGLFAGNIVPTAWQLEFAVPLSFIAILVSSVRSVATGVAALVGGVASVALFALPLKLGLVAACAGGLLAGLMAEKGVQRWTARKAG